MANIFRFFVAATLSVIVLTSTIAADHPVTYKVEAPVSVQSGQSIELAVTFDIEEGWYIYAPTGANTAQGMIETKIAFTSPDGMTVGEVQFPAYVDSGSFQIYEGAGIEMRQTLYPAGDLAPGNYKIKGKIRYQTCNVELCLPPRTDTVHVNVIVE